MAFLLLSLLACTLASPRPASDGDDGKGKAPSDVGPTSKEGSSSAPPTDGGKKNLTDVPSPADDKPGDEKDAVDPKKQDDDGGGSDSSKDIDMDSSVGSSFNLTDALAKGDDGDSAPHLAVVVPSQRHRWSRDRSSGTLLSSFRGTFAPFWGSQVVSSSGVDWKAGEKFHGGFNAAVGMSEDNYTLALGGGWLANATALTLGASAERLGVKVSLYLAIVDGRARLTVNSTSLGSRECKEHTDDSGHYLSSCAYT